MATTTPNFGWSVPTSTDLVKDGATAIETLGDAIDASLADLKGGTTGQILSKNSGTDMDFTWVTSAGDIEGVTAGVGISGGGTSGTVTITNSMATAITTAGDLITGTGSGTFDRLGIGSTGQVLTVSGGAPTWVSPAGGGKVLQVVTAYYGTQVTSSSSTYIDSGLTATITPSSATSQVLVIVAQNGCTKSSGNASNGIGLRLLRDGSNQIGFAYEGLQTGTTITNKGSFPVTLLDSPATTSAVVYKTQLANTGTSAASVSANHNATSSITLMEIGA